MPNRDKTGPTGQGPGTGRGLGSCGDQGLSLGFGRRFGFGCGRGFGRGLGRFFGWNQPQTKEEKAQALSDYRQALEEELEDIKKLQQESK